MTLGQVVPRRDDPAERTAFRIASGGPAKAVKLQWVTYFDTEDGSGMACRVGAVLIQTDNDNGGRLGIAVSEAAVEAATRVMGEEQWR